jgi:nondiscriminating glutamyl-tRNA synthetase
VSLALPHLIKAGYASETPSEAEKEWVRELIALHQEKLSFGAEIIEHVSLFFKDQVEWDEEGRQVLAEEQVPTVLNAFLNLVSELGEFTPESIQAALKQVQKDTGFKGKQLFMPVRVAVSGQTHGPDLLKTISLLGKEKVTERLSWVIDNCSSLPSQ